MDLDTGVPGGLIAGGPFVVHQDKSNSDKKWRRIIAAAKIPHITRHDLRRTAITRAPLANMPPVVVKEIAGQKDLKTTLSYSRRSVGKMFVKP